MLWMKRDLICEESDGNKRKEEDAFYNSDYAVY